MNRYWFSPKQKEQQKKTIKKQKEQQEKTIKKYCSNSKAEVLTDDGWKEYTQWC